MPRAVLLGAALVMAGLVPASPPRGSLPAKPAALHAPVTGQVTAHDGKFWLGSQEIVLEGTNAKCCSTADFPTIRSWGMNILRLQFFWSRLEPNPPMSNGDGTWTHHYDQDYLDDFAALVAGATQAGLYVMVGNHGCQCTYFRFPDWLYLSPYNSHLTTYPRTETGSNLAQADFWSDPLRQQFMVDALRAAVTRLKSIPGIAGYEILNEPQQGLLSNSHETTAIMLAWQLTAAQAIRAVDPARIVFFTTRSGYGPGVPDADLSGWQSLGNVAFDVHDYYGGRWGSGFVENPEDPSYHEAMESMYNHVLSDDTPLPAFPYIGTTYGQVRMLGGIEEALAPWGIPLIVGEMGNRGDDGVMLYFGSVTAAIDELGLSWTSSTYDGTAGIIKPDGTFQPWANLIIDLADQ